MSRYPYHTSPVLEEQLAALNEEGWQQAVVSQLPPDWEGAAYQHEAYVRDREVAGPAQLLRAVVAYVLASFSFAQLGAWAVLVGLPNLSATAWRKRLRQCHGWLWWLLQEVLTPSQVGPLVPKAAQIRRIQLIDTTRLNEPGGSGDDYRVHLAYDLLSGRFSQISLSDCHGAESFSRFDWQAGDVAVGDSGYGYRRCVSLLSRLGAFAVVRISPRSFPLLQQDGTPLDPLRWLNELPQGIHERAVGFDFHGQRYEARLIAKSLSAEHAERKRAAKRKLASKKGRHLKDETLFLCGWIVLICTVPRGVWSAQEVLLLYQARWQIELLFKRMKQLLRLCQLRGKTQLTNEVTILACLLSWALMDQQVSQVRELLGTLYAPQEPHGQEPGEPEEDHAGEAQAEPSPHALTPLSEWTLSVVALHTLRGAVLGVWTVERVQQCLPQVQRHLRYSPRQRRHQRHRILAWLSQETRSQPEASSLLFHCSGA